MAKKTFLIAVVFLVMLVSASLQEELDDLPGRYNYLVAMFKPKQNLLSTVGKYHFMSMQRGLKLKGRKLKVLLLLSF